MRRGTQLILIFMFLGVLVFIQASSDGKWFRALCAAAWVASWGYVLVRGFPGADWLQDRIIRLITRPVGLLVLGMAFGLASAAYGSWMLLAPWEDLLAWGRRAESLMTGLEKLGGRGFARAAIAVPCAVAAWASIRGALGVLRDLLEPAKVGREQGGGGGEGEKG